MYPRLKALFVGLALGISALLSRAEIDVRIGANFTGSQFGVDSTSSPPDTDGAIGPGHFVEFINGRFSVYNRTNGVRVLTSTDLDFWKNAGISFRLTLDVTDPRVVFDPQSQRWFAAQIDYDTFASSNRFLVAVSKTADPTAGWRAMAFKADASGNRFADFPTLGIDSAGIYLGANIFEPNSSIFDGVLLVSIPKADLLGATPTVANRTSFGIMPTASRGFVLQPVVNLDAGSTTEAVIAVPGDGTDFLPLTTLKKTSIQNAGRPGLATLGATVDLTVPPFLIPLNPPQPDPTADLDDGDSRISSSIVQVNNIIYVVTTVDVGTTNNPLAALRWYKLSPINNLVLQTGTISNSALHFFYPSIAANSNGIVVIGFNGSSSNSFVSSYAVVGETVNGSTRFGSPILLKEGISSYNDPDLYGTSRWGDYSATSLDPVDPTHFWTIQAYPVSIAGWATQISEIIVQPPPRLSVTHSGNSLQVAWPTNYLGFTLEYASTLPTNSWSVVPEGFGVRGGNFVVTNGTTELERVYRLRK